MGKFILFMAMTIPPWALMGQFNEVAGLIGLSVQIVGLIGMLWVVFSGRLFDEPYNA